MPIGKDNKRVVYYYDEEVGNFYYGQNHPMKPHRMRMTHSLIVNYGLFKKMEIYRPYRVSERDLTLFHADDYVHFLKCVTIENQETWGTDLEKFNIDVDCPIFDGMYRFCQIAAGGSVGGAYKLNHGLADIAVNWAGGLHHAKKSEASGFCYVNDIVLSILELLKTYNRVVYVDIDIHHGDGVEEAFYTTDRVMTVSFHKYGDFFPGTGALEDKGVMAGKNYSINVPLEEGMDDDSFHYIFKPLMKKVIDHFQPGAIVMQLGADSLAGDRLGCFNLSVRGHGECLDYLRAFNLPLLMLGGGGYTLRNVARCWTHETSVACGVELENKIPYNEYYEYFAPDYVLSTLPTNMVNLNKRSSLDHIFANVSDYLRELPHAPNTQTTERQADHALTATYSEGFEKLKADIEEEAKQDERIPTFLRDKLREHDNEIYADDKDQDGTTIHSLGPPPKSSPTPNSKPDSTVLTTTIPVAAAASASASVSKPEVTTTQASNDAPTDAPTPTQGYSAVRGGSVPSVDGSNAAAESRFDPYSGKNKKSSPPPITTRKKGSKSPPAIPTLTTVAEDKSLDYIRKKANDINPNQSSLSIMAEQGSVNGSETDKSKSNKDLTKSDKTDKNGSSDGNNDGMISAATMAAKKATNDTIVDKTIVESSVSTPVVTASAAAVNNTSDPATTTVVKE